MAQTIQQKIMYAIKGGKREIHLSENHDQIASAIRQLLNSKNFRYNLSFKPFLNSRKNEPIRISGGIVLVTLFN